MNHSLQFSVAVAFRLFSGMCICHTSSVHLLKLYPYVSHLIDAHCVRNSLHRGRLSVTAKYIVVDAAIAACTCQMHTGEDTSEIYGRIMRTFVASRGGEDSYYPLVLDPHPFRDFLPRPSEKAGLENASCSSSIASSSSVFEVVDTRDACPVPRERRNSSVAQSRGVIARKSEPCIEDVRGAHATASRHHRRG